MTPIRFSNDDFDGQFSRTLWGPYYGAGDLGEAFATADRLGAEPTYDEWYEEWTTTAEHARQVADASLAGGHHISAQRAYLRAAEYYRQAYFFIRKDLDDKRLLTAHAAARECFRAAAPLLSDRVEAVEIPYQGTTLPGYLAHPADVSERRPVVVFPCGYDSTAEAGWSYLPDALARGFSALVFEGPGQGSVLYEQRLYFRADFEAVLTPVLDWLISRADVDAHRIILVGRSFAGYLAPRAATAEHRIAALVCDPGQFDLGSGFARLIGADLVSRALAGDTTVDDVLEPRRQSSARMAELTGARMASHDVHTFREWIVEMQKWTLEGRAHRITCPTLIVEGASDPVGGQSKLLFDSLICPKRLEILGAEAGADGHCGGLGQATWAQVVYDWIEETIGMAG